MDDVVIGRAFPSFTPSMRSVPSPHLHGATITSAPLLFTLVHGAFVKDIWRASGGGFNACMVDKGQ